MHVFFFVLFLLEIISIADHEINEMKKDMKNENKKQINEMETLLTKANLESIIILNKKNEENILLLKYEHDDMILTMKNKFEQEINQNNMKFTDVINDLINENSESSVRNEEKIRRDYVDKIDNMSQQHLSEILTLNEVCISLCICVVSTYAYLYLYIDLHKFLQFVNVCVDVNIPFDKVDSISMCMYLIHLYM